MSLICDRIFYVPNTNTLSSLSGINFMVRYWTPPWTICISTVFDAHSWFYLPFMRTIPLYTPLYIFLTFCTKTAITTLCFSIMILYYDSLWRPTTSPQPIHRVVWCHQWHIKINERKTVAVYLSKTLSYPNRLTINNTILSWKHKKILNNTIK